MVLLSHSIFLIDKPEEDPPWQRRRIPRASSSIRISSLPCPQVIEPLLLQSACSSFVAVLPSSFPSLLSWAALHQNRLVLPRHSPIVVIVVQELNATSQSPYQPCVQACIFWPSCLIRMPSVSRRLCPPALLTIIISALMLKSLGIPTPRNPYYQE
jgi:hypothetical protein